MIGTKILKINSEIAEIIEVKVGTRHTGMFVITDNREAEKQPQLSQLFLNRFSKFMCLSSCNIFS